MKVYDVMGYVAGKLPLRPPASQLGLTPTVYFGFNAATPTPDLQKAAGIGNCLPQGSDVCIDLETAVAACVNYQGAAPSPSPNRAVYQKAIVDTMAALRSNPRGASCKYVPYASCLGAMNAYNGATWLSGNQSTCQTVFLEPVPGAPNGIGNLFETKLVSVYVFYNDPVLAQKNLVEKARLMRLLYPAQKIVAACSARFASGYDIPDRRLDYMTGAEMQTHLATVTNLFDEILLFDSALYGVKGTTLAQRQAGTGYALAGPNGWDEQAEWWQVVKSYMRTTTVPYNGNTGEHHNFGSFPQ